MKTIISHDHDGNAYEVPVTDLVWRPTAYAVIIRDGQILLSPQWVENGYDLPGGGMDIGETPEEAVIREVKEETGYDVVVKEFLDHRSTFYHFHTRKIDAQRLIYYFICEIVGGEISTDGFDEREKNYAKAAEWISLADLPGIRLMNTVDWREILSHHSIEL